MDKREMTTGEAEAWRIGYNTARAQALLLVDRLIPDEKTRIDIIGWLRSMRPEARRK